MRCVEIIEMPFIAHHKSFTGLAGRSSTLFGVSSKGRELNNAGLLLAR